MTLATTNEAASKAGGGSVAERRGSFIGPSVRRSLLFRLAMALSLIVVIALLGILSSLVIAEKLRGAATAVNDAGKLRYSTYQAAMRSLQPEVSDVSRQQADLMVPLDRFEHYYRGGSISRMVPADPDHPLRTAYEEVGRLWDRDIRSLLVSGLGRAPDGPFYAELSSRVDVFVGRVDRMVHLLELRIERQVQALRWIQGLCQFLTLAVMLFAIYVLRRDLVRPLRGLLDGAEAMRKGNFGRRIAHTGDDELGRLGSAFNRMAQDLAESYGDLERRVSEKTRALESSNRSLELLYRSLSHLHDGTLSRANYSGTLREMSRVLGFGDGSLCLLERDGEKGFRLADTVHDPEFVGPLCPRGNCADCLDGGGNGARWVDLPDGSRHLVVPLHDGGDVHALLQLRVPKETALEDWQVQLVEAIGRHLGIAVAVQRRTIQARRLALLEERATIARELHDSLAQALSYLKIQVTLLEAALKGVDRREAVDSVLHDLREGLNDAYAQLRELLTTFRIGLGGQGFGHAIEETVAGVATRGPQRIELENRLADGELDINEEVHLVQIVREALCNVQRHAQASRARVSLGWNSEQEVCVRIADDGVGIRDPEAERSGHYGMAIMRERARQLDGRLKVGPGPDGGTCVELCFRPAGTAVGTSIATQPLPSHREEA